MKLNCHKIISFIILFTYIDSSSDDCWYIDGTFTNITWLVHVPMLVHWATEPTSREVLSQSQWADDASIAELLSLLADIPAAPKGPMQFVVLTI